MFKMGKEKMKYVSEFVKRQKAIDALNINNLLWNSSKHGTYRRSQRGELPDIYNIKKTKPTFKLK